MLFLKILMIFVKILLKWLLICIRHLQFACAYVITHTIVKKTTLGRIHNVKTQNVKSRFRAFLSPLSLTEYKSQRNRLKSIVKEKKSLNIQNVRKKTPRIKKWPKKFWNTIKNIGNRNITPNTIILESWFEHFKKLLLIPNQDSLQKTCSEDEVRNSIKQIRSGKSGDPDGILIEMLKTTMVFICPILTKLFKNTIDHGEFPESWGESILCQILRKGSVTQTIIGEFRLSMYLTKFSREY